MAKALSAKHIKEFITNALMIREIPYIYGPPGIGKSDIVFQIGEEWNLKVLDIRLSQMLPEDLTGLPSLDTKINKAIYNPFDTFPMEGDDIPEGYSGWIIFLDELSSASEEVMAAIYALLLGHTVGGKKVHSKALIVAAGNRASDSAIARELPDTLITRMLPVEMKVSSSDWINWAKSIGKKGNENVISFIEKYPDTLMDKTKSDKREELESFSTPRGWNKVFKFVNLHEKKSKKEKTVQKDIAGLPISDKTFGNKITPDIKALIYSAVSVIHGSSFIEFYDETMELPYPWEVAQSPSSTRIPNNHSGKAQLVEGLSEHYKDTLDQNRESILIYMNRMDKEYAALFVESLRKKLKATENDNKMLEYISKRLGV
jgi:phenylpyruvate tautomerase PptA (4-oxalocrotonate tautomerase family)